MTGGANQGAAPKRPGSGGWIHFGVAAGILLLAAVGFHTAVASLRIHLVKAPVPWPEGTEVAEHRLMSFPERIGAYVQAADGELNRETDGEPDGAQVIAKELLDEMDVTKSPQNWYFQGIYRDSRAPGTYKTRGGLYFWLSITYYTGMSDPVPHVAEVCLGASGADILARETVTLTVPTDQPEWRSVGVRRVAYAIRRPGAETLTSAQYYLFSMNGTPTSSRTKVRKDLMLPWNKYCYYAKIQVAMLRPQRDLRAGDDACREFLREAIAAALRFLPSAEDVEKLERIDGNQRS